MSIFFFGKKNVHINQWLDINQCLESETPAGTSQMTWDEIPASQLAIINQEERAGVVSLFDTS